MFTGGWFVRREKYYGLVIDLFPSEDLRGSRTCGWLLRGVMSVDNVVWTDSWLSIAGVGCGLTGVGAGEEQVRKVVASETSMCGDGK
jgi:hypothetical protein